MKFQATRKQFLTAIGHRRICAELGVQAGGHAKQMMQFLRPDELHLIDCWQYQDDYEDIANVPQEKQDQIFYTAQQRMNPYSDRVTFHREFTVPAMNLFPNFYFDLVYIDANHQVDAIYNDIIACVPKMKEHGVIAGHDFSHRWISVVEAVKQFLKLHPNYELVAFTNIGKEWVIAKLDEARRLRRILLESLPLSV